MPNPRFKLVSLIFPTLLLVLSVNAGAQTAKVSGSGQPAVAMRLITYNSGVRLSSQTW